MDRNDIPKEYLDKVDNSQTGIFKTFRPAIEIKEKESIMKNISDKEYIITMEIDGNEIDSVTFANKLDSIQVINSNIVFIIGGSYGLHSDIKALSNYKLSFSKMTFPHQLFRVILLEQIYRAFKINNNETYHK